MRDEAVRRLETWSGFLTKANIHDVRKRIEEMFCSGQLVVAVTDYNWAGGNWPEVHSGITLSDPTSDYRPDQIPSAYSPMILTVSAPDTMHMWSTVAEDQADAQRHADVPVLRFTHNTLMIRSHSPSGHQIYHIFTHQLDHDGNVQRVKEES